MQAEALLRGRKPVASYILQSYAPPAWIYGPACRLPPKPALSFGCKHGTPKQRASEKVTFPDLWTNTCCPHPLAVPDEMGVDLPSSIVGAQRAARRKLNHELGIHRGEVPLEDFKFLTRIHYLAASDGKWGEHEIDYVLLIKLERGGVALEVNPNEVRDTRWISSAELLDMFKDPAPKFTPWFKLICDIVLSKWWEHLDSGLGNLGDDEIRRIHKKGTLA
ncbi:isopentenyl-diphosphate delta-isomerase [Diplodia corticola]|uniref:isopentenyl-diphosphate Delta-isomerase n=1 Tax=Diplodia corticola TaxID=236234 RepID=A0A1J9QIP2_9PEZI|nr:isopentenyl-diphosphate delta-isomerase [Diplodia corticola]OJD28718.1 isopentenyl-diphosphate delta-isomerase [Diplodia corticola]